MRILILCFLCFSLESFSKVQIQKSFMQENDLWIPDTDRSSNGMTKELFNSIIDKVENVYKPIVEQKRGRLIVHRKWSDGTVNAYAHRTGRTYRVVMFGGLARHPLVTGDAFALVICHELGHHLGGIPKMPFFTNVWASNEGQADYYATLKCMRKVFIGDDNTSLMANKNVPNNIKELCANSFSNSNEQFLCQRSAMAGYSLAKVLQQMTGSDIAPSLSKKDMSIVSKTKHMHPDTQCRLDTYLAGAICHVSDTQDVSYRNESLGVCYKANGDNDGYRPRCWFKPRK